MKDRPHTFWLSILLMACGCVADMERPATDPCDFFARIPNVGDTIIYVGKQKDLYDSCFEKKGLRISSMCCQNIIEDTLVREYRYVFKETGFKGLYDFELIEVSPPFDSTMDTREKHFWRVWVAYP